MEGLYVIDTVGFINFFREFFNEDEKLSKKARQIINNCFDYTNPNLNLVFQVLYLLKFSKSSLRAKKMS